MATTYSRSTPWRVSWTETSAARTLMRSSGISNRSCSSACRCKARASRGGRWRCFCFLRWNNADPDSSAHTHHRNRCSADSGGGNARVDERFPLHNDYSSLSFRFWCRGENQQTTKSSVRTAQNGHRLLGLERILRDRDQCRCGTGAPRIPDHTTWPSYNATTPTLSSRSSRALSGALSCRTRSINRTSQRCSQTIVLDPRRPLFWRQDISMIIEQVGGIRSRIHRHARKCSSSVICIGADLRARNRSRAPSALHGYRRADRRGADGVAW
jgi:hypothetical protein